MASRPDAAGSPAGLRLVIGITFVAALSAWVLWMARILPRRSGLGHVLPSVASLDTLSTPPGAWGAAVFAAVAATGALIRTPGLARADSLAAMIGMAALSGLAVFVSPVGHHVGIAGFALVSAVLAAAWIGGRRSAALDLMAESAGPSSVRTERRVAAALWGAVAVTHMVFSMHRHWAFGSGSWDHGCMVHNFYLASRFLPTTSTVLGNVDFLGDHFMIGIYLYAPLIWLSSSGYTILAIQSVNLACVAPAVYLIARHHRAPHGPAVALGLATGLSFGLQSAAFFDSHEITVGFGFLAWGLWAFETGRLRVATALFVLFALFKESLGAYVVALGLLAVWRGFSRQDRKTWQYGLIWMAWGVVWFIVVNRVFMPALIARANPPEPHETFGDFGPTVFQAVVGIVSQPLKAFGALFVPGDKLWSHLTTLGGLGWLAVLSPDIGVAALPLLAERFLSAKGTMWQMGYHYAAPLSLYAGWAAARGYRRAERWAQRGLTALGGPRLAAGATSAIVVYVAVSALLINEFGYRHAANYHRWTLGYFSKPERRHTNAQAVAFVHGQGRAAKVAVQNRILPHLADRPHVYRLGDWPKADWVVVSIGENAWPWNERFVSRLASRLNRDPQWRLVFARGGTGVFARTSVTDLPEVAASPALGLAR